MPYKHNASRRHRIPEMKFKVTNWPDYEGGLRRRGGLTLRLTPEALVGWQRTTRGGQARYSDLAIETVLTLGCVFGLRLRQSAGLMTNRMTHAHARSPSAAWRATHSRRHQRTKCA